MRRHLIWIEEDWGARRCGKHLDPSNMDNMDVTCTATRVETVSGEYLCPECDADLIKDLKPCYSCGLYHSFEGDYCHDCYL